jgi:xanthine dehydrogenase accessory factor
MDPFDDLDRIRGAERRAILATLVGMRGTSPRREGARMWVGESGSILGSVTIGGCVDAEVLHASADVLAAETPALITVEIADDDARAMGLSCAGSVDVLLRPVALEEDRDDPLLAAWRKVSTHVDRGGRAVVAVPLPADDRTPVEETNVLVLLDDDTTHGSLGDADLDADALIQAAGRLRRGESGVASLHAGDRTVPVYFEVHGRGALLVVIGGSAIADPLTRMARLLGMYTIVIEGRERFAQPERYPDADEALTGLPSRLIEGMSFDSSSAIVLIAHDYKFDVPVLEKAVTTDAGYIGMLGSRKRTAGMAALLAERGMDAGSIARIRMPIGLDIGGQSAAGIALSILAEIVAVRAGRSGGAMKDRAAPPAPPDSPSAGAAHGV